MTDTPRFVLAHGFTQTARSWERFERSLGQRIPAAEFAAVDLPGHGEAVVPSSADLWQSAAHLVSAGGRGTYVGYSMGGRVSLHAALDRPDAVESLVLIGATAGIDDPVERADRRAADERLAERVESIGVEAFVDQWLSNPLFAGLDAGTSLRADRLRNTAGGLAASLRATGTGVQEPLWSRLGEIQVPALVMAGEHDRKFRTLGARLAAGLPRATFVVIEGAGHSVHLEQPDATAEAVARWYDEMRN
jgi:2-succinyl-6-hydroxy-2,4-cyclohexadiene-1-carboxylate synthase